MIESTGVQNYPNICRKILGDGLGGRITLIRKVRAEFKYQLGWRNPYLKQIRVYRKRLALGIHAETISLEGPKIKLRAGSP